MRGPGNLLVVDFTGVDADRKFDGLIPPAWQSEVHKVDPLESHFERRLSLADQADEIAEGSRRPVEFVLGFCAAAALVVNVAARLHTGTHIPHVVLIDPYQVSEDRLRREFATLFDNLGGDADAAVAATRGDTGEALLQRLEAALLSRRDILVESCGGEAAADVAMYLLYRYRAWLRFLSASARAAVPWRQGPISVMSSASGVDLSGVVADPDGIVVHRWNIDDAQLASPHLYDKVHQVLSGT